MLAPRESPAKEIKTYRDLADGYLQMRSAFAMCEADKAAAQEGLNSQPVGVDRVKSLIRRLISWE